MYTIDLFGNIGRLNMKVSYYHDLELRLQMVVDMSHLH